MSSSEKGKKERPVVLEARGLRYRYPGHRHPGEGKKGARHGDYALRDVDLKVRRGETVVILGPNGAGKTTLLHLLAGLEPPTGGTVLVGGAPVHSKGKGRSGIPSGTVGLLFQDPDDQLFMARAHDDVAFGPLNQELPEEEVRRRVRWAMKAAGVEGYDDRLPHHLSTGEKKRVAIAGVLAMKPKALLMDEPTANLDPRGRRELMELIRGLGRTAVIATHDVDAAVELADRVVVLDGKVLAEGTPGRIFGDAALLRRAGLEATRVAELFLRLREAGVDFHGLPLTVDEAAKILRSSKALRDADGNRPAVPPEGHHDR